MLWGRQDHHDTDAVFAWFSICMHWRSLDHKLSLNFGKCYAMYMFSAARTNIADLILHSLFIISCTEQVKILGVIFNSLLSWSTHSNYAHLKISRIFSTLQRFGCALDSLTRKRIFKSRHFLMFSSACLSGVIWIFLNVIYSKTACCVVQDSLWGILQLLSIQEHIILLAFYLFNLMYYYVTLWLFLIFYTGMKLTFIYMPIYFLICRCITQGKLKAENF